MSIIIKSKREIEAMRHVGHIVAKVLEVLKREIKLGMKTKELDSIACKELEKRGARPSFKGYRGFPASLCVSINNEIVHGIPGERIMDEGDIISRDLGAIYEGFQGDAAVSVILGDGSPQAKKLVEATEKALEVGIEAANNGARLGDISAAIQMYAESRGYSVVREYTGHGIGRQMHEEPQIPNFGRKGEGPKLKKGMTLALEPMLNIGSWRTCVGGDGWVVSTIDGSLSAHFEHTIAITDGKPEILTAF
ncbi:MAG: type I methionyl aminopeptidase [Dehalococcoidia bacterium]|nr:MAG: type I methionyl aminopeptidase [Dehalococcoidia bacterium]